MQKLRLSTSRVTEYLHCPKAYFWHYKENLAVKKKSKPLQVGDFTHVLLQKDAEGTLTKDYIANFQAEFQKAYPDNLEQETIDAAYDSLNYYLGFKKKYENDKKYLIESTEVNLECDMGLYDLFTRVDTFLRSEDARLWRGEYKTAGKLDSAYLSGLKGGLQAGISYIVTSSVMPEKVNGTIYDLIVKTKVPQYERTMILAEKGLVERTIACLNGVCDGILNERFYPSMMCHYYNRECDYLPLCKNDTINTREAFYEDRVEFYNKPKR